MEWYLSRDKKADKKLLQNKVVYLQDAHRILRPNDIEGITRRDTMFVQKREAYFSHALTPFDELYDEKAL